MILPSACAQDSVRRVLHQGSEAGLGPSQRVFDVLAFADVPENSRIADDLSLGVTKRRNGESHVDLPSAFRDAHGFMMHDLLSAHQALQTPARFAEPVRRDDP